MRTQRRAIPPRFVWPLLAAVLAAVPLRSARGGPLTLSGYVRESPFLWSGPAVAGEPAGRAPGEFTNLVHTRENLRAYASSWLTLGLEAKTRWFAGDAAQALLNEADLTGGNPGRFDWQRRFVDTRRSVLVSAIDRAWINVEAGRTQLTLGRQRIAWGTDLVWNPIDLFNPASPLDFDNEEKPGTDAGRLQVYLGPDSKAELAVAPMSRGDDAIAAGQLVVNHDGYDWVAIAGRRGPTTVLGGAWAGSIRGGGFRGEFLYSIPRRGLVLSGFHTLERSDLVGSVDGDYTCANSLYLHGAWLYNERGSTSDAGGVGLLEANRRGWLSPARHSLFAEIARNLGPLVRADLAGMINPGDHSWYAGPSLTWSVVTNVDATASGFVFGGASGTEFGDDSTLLMARLKWSF